MSDVTAVAIERTALITSVGLSAPASCAAIRAKVANPRETRFLDSQGEWIIGHEVALGRPWRGLEKLSRMAAMAVEECLADVSRDRWPSIPILLCVAERDRPGRQERVDDLLVQLERILGSRFAKNSSVIAQGRISMAIALSHARSLMYEHAVPLVLVAAADSYLNWASLRHYDLNGRLLASSNSNGFMPGEGAGALLVAPEGKGSALVCTGIGFGVETASVESEAPLRGEGLTASIKAALADAGCAMHELDFRIADLSGEHYYFKEAALALGRTLKRPKETFDLWHPAECTGETGAVVGISMVALADAACRKGYAPGAHLLTHAGSDSGRRAAAVFRFRDTR